MLYNLMVEDGKSKYMSDEEILEYYNKNKDSLLTIYLRNDNIPAKQVANYSGWITYVTSNNVIGQAWAGEFSLNKIEIEKGLDRRVQMSNQIKGFN